MCEMCIRDRKYTTQVHRLEEMMPMCSYCKKIRDDKNYWQQIESYINERTGTEISHSVCPECYLSLIHICCWTS